MSSYVNDLALLSVLFFLGVGLIISVSVFGLTYLAYRKLRRTHRPQVGRKRR
jgi:membrane-associated protease RseP (regulator of RpoE activity)